MAASWDTFLHHSDGPGYPVRAVLLKRFMSHKYFLAIKLSDTYNENRHHRTVFGQKTAEPE
jgi:hypothetical protein